MQGRGGDDDEIDLRELFIALWRGKGWIIATTLLGAVLAVLVAINKPNIYRAEALLAPSSEQQGGGLSAMAAQFGGLASLAGVNLKGGGPDKTAIAAENVVSGCCRVSVKMCFSMAPGDTSKV